MIMSFLRNRTPIINRTPGGMKTPIFGLVLHQQMGTESGTEAWFHNSSAQASSHFGAPKQPYSKTELGDQWVDTFDKAWAQVAGNANWWSVENEGNGEPLTANQVEIAAQIMAFLHLHDGVPLQVSDSPSVKGLGWHGMGGQAWGGHLDCGKGFLAQRPAILKRAQDIVTAASPKPPPKPVAKSAPRVAGKPATKPQTLPKPTRYQYKRTLRLGSIGGDVCHLQRAIGLHVTGFYGTRTRDKVKMLQRLNRLTVDGIFGPQSRQKFGW